MPTGSMGRTELMGGTALVPVLTGRSRCPPLWQKLLAGVALTLVYYGAGKLGLSLAHIHPSASAVWPNTGIALAALLILGSRFFPAILLGALLVNVTAAGNLGSSVGIAAGNTLEALAGTYLVNRFADGRAAFDSPQGFVRFVLFGPIASTTISATIGVSSLALAGSVGPAEFHPIWLTWWAGDAVGAITFAPLIVLWANRPRVDWRGTRALEAACLLAALVGLSLLSFGVALPRVTSYPLTFLPVAVLMWAAFRFGPRGAAASGPVVGVTAICSTMAGYGPFSPLPAHEALLTLQIFLGFVSGMAVVVAIVVAQVKAGVMALREAQEALDQKVRERTARLAEANSVLAAEMTERQQAQRELSESEAMFRSLLESAADAIVIVAPDGSIRIVNSQTEKFFGYDRKELLGQPVELLIPERYRERHVDNRAGYVANPRARAMGEGLELFGRRKDGSEFPIDISLSPLATREGIMVSAAIRDITRRKRAERERRANEMLRSQVEELSRRTREITTLNRMGDLLRAATSVAEVYPLVAKFLEGLFPGDSGTLYVFNSARTFLEAVASWGKSPPTEVVVKRDECWALRRGQPHRIDEPDGGTACQHMPQPPATRSLCIPMMGQGETLGLFHMVAGPRDKDDKDKEGAGDDASMVEYWQRLAQATSEQIAGALASARLQETLRTHASRDALTGLLNRRSFEEALACELQRTGRRRSRLGLLMIDLDHFKRFNDRFGHAAGDLALREIGKLLQQQCRKGDILCRFGGEEMTVVLADCSAADTRRRAEQLRAGAASLRLEHEGRAMGTVTLSVGIALFPEHGHTVEALLRAADKALYKAKGGGRNRIVVAGAEEAANPGGKPAGGGRSADSVAASE